MEGSVWPNKNEEVAHRSPVLKNVRTHARIADRLEITEFIAQSVALRYQGAVFRLVVSGSTNLASVERQRIEDALADWRLKRFRKATKFDR